MIRVSYGDATDFDALLYGNKHPNTIQYLQAEASNVSPILSDGRASFFANMHDLVERANGEEAMRLARAAIRKAGSLFQPDRIKSIWDLGGLQTAPMTMQRWIMAEPTVREMYHEQRCDGFADTYIDMEPGKIGDEHYDYRRVMQGIVVDDPENDWRATIYLDDIAAGDRELELDEQIDILNTWDVVAALMNYGIDDPTSVFGSKL